MTQTRKRTMMRATCRTSVSASASASASAKAAPSLIALSPSKTWPSLVLLVVVLLLPPPLVRATSRSAFAVSRRPIASASCVSARERSSGGGGSVVDPLVFSTRTRAATTMATASSFCRLAPLSSKVRGRTEEGRMATVVDRDGLAVNGEPASVTTNMTSKTTAATNGLSVDGDARGDRDTAASSSSSRSWSRPWWSSLPSRWSLWVRRSVFLGIDPTPEVVAIMAIYFVEGALGLARLAQTFLLKDTLHLGPAEMSALTGLLALPWTIKPLYGFLSDGFPLFGYRRRSYLIAAGALGCLAYSALGSDFWGLLPSPSSDLSAPSISSPSSSSYLLWTVAALLLSSATIALSDVVADGIVVQRTRDSNDPTVAGGLQSLCWGSAALGGLITAYLSGSLLETVGPRNVFALTAALPACVAGIALLIDEEPAKKKIMTTTTTTTTAKKNMTTKTKEAHSEKLEASVDTGVTVDEEEEEEGDDDEEGENLLDGVKSQIGGLLSAFRDPAIWKPSLFLFLWQSTPTGEGAMLYFMTNDLGFGPEFLGRVRLVSSVSSLVGVWLYQKYLRTIPIKDVLLWTSIASAPLGLTNLLLISHTNRALGIPDGAFVFGDDVALSILGELAFLPTLVLAAKLCPPGIEAVLFATLMSIFNGASTVGTEIGAALTKYLGVTESNFDNLGLLTIICNVSSLYPLVFIGWLDDVGSVSEEDIEKEMVLDVAAAPDSERKC